MEGTSKICIFAPEGSYFSKCKKCGSPSLQSYSHPDDCCIWCRLHDYDEEIPSDDPKGEDVPL